MITSLRKIAPLEFFHKDRTFHPLGNEVTGQRGNVRSEAKEGDFVKKQILMDLNYNSGKALK